MKTFEKALNIFLSTTLYRFLKLNSKFLQLIEKSDTHSITVELCLIRRSKKRLHTINLRIAE